MLKFIINPYEEKITRLEEKKQNGIELTEKERKKYRDMKYAQSRLERQRQSMKCMSIAIPSIIIGAILNLLLPTKMKIVFICLFWLYTIHIIYMYKKNMLREFKHVRHIWMIFISFTFVSVMLLGDFNYIPHWLFNLIFWSIFIYGLVCAMIIYGYGKKVSNE